MTETASETPPEPPPENAAEAVAEPRSAPKAQAGTPVWVWVVYVLGALAAMVFAASIAFVVLASLTNGDGSSGIDISTPAFIVWLALAVAGLGTFVWRRWGRPR